MKKYLITSEGQVVQSAVRQPVLITEETLRAIFPEVPTEEGDVLSYLKAQAPQALAGVAQFLTDSVDSHRGLETVFDPKGKAWPEWEPSEVCEDDGDAYRWLFEPAEVTVSDLVDLIDRAASQLDAEVPEPLAALCASKVAAGDAARRAGRRDEARERYEVALSIDPGHGAAVEALEALAGMASLPDWHSEWMSDCGEDEFGCWASVNIAGVEHRFRYCAPGTFKMGSPASEQGRDGDEGPQHSVTLTRGFWLGEAPVTQRQWAAVTGSNPSGFKGDDRPVETVNWHDCEAWMAQASARGGGLGLRFPTEAEWEYACQAGTTGATYRGGNDAATLDAIAWYSANSGDKTHPVKQKAPNPWGLYDMLGNVWEWCADNNRGYSASAVVDPSGDDEPEDYEGEDVRVYRGGSWSDLAQFARAAYRDSVAPFYRDIFAGFRLARGQ